MKMNQGFKRQKKHYTPSYDIIIYGSDLSPDKFRIKDNNNSDNNAFKKYITLYFYLQECISQHKKGYHSSITPRTKLDTKLYLHKEYSINSKKHLKKFRSDKQEVLTKKCYSFQKAKYGSRFKNEDVSFFISKGYDPKKINKYDQRFDGEDIVNLVKADCSPKKANKYDRNLDGYKIAVLFAMGIEPNDPLQSLDVRMMNLIGKATNFGGITEIAKKFERAKEFSQLGTGISGIVILRNENAWKFSKEMSHEYNILKKIQNHHKDKQKNIIKIKGEPQNFFSMYDEFITIPYPILEIEHVKGDSLENILNKHRSLTKNNIIHYASDIVNGLIEMRKAGVQYHRDIRPANIMIDAEKDRAVIIDFGIATTNKKLSSKDNRRYGGINDLISLGQIIYKMANGEHLFAKSKSMERTTHAQKIKDYRDKVYSDKTEKLLKKHFEQIDRKIKDEQLRTLIKSCLTAKNYHYKKIQRMFQKLILDDRD